VPSSPTTDLDRFCGFAERFLTDEQGRPLVIEPFQPSSGSRQAASTRRQLSTRGPLAGASLAHSTVAIAYGLPFGITRSCEVAGLQT
jgi:hypothetical protein